MANPIFNKLDPDAIARVKAGIRHKPQPVKKLKPPRHARAYRAARRNDVLRGEKSYVWEGAPAKVHHVGFGDEAFGMNGDKPCARRARQIASGRLRAENGVAQ